MKKEYEKFIRLRMLPSIWCPGCGNGIVLGSFIRAFYSTGIDRNSTVVVSGIGCTGRISQYLDFDTVHTTHGRALALATGIKLANPRLHIVVFMGDGDAMAIGGNHFIHAARRNIDLTSIIINNAIYGMTGGQESPTTPKGKKTKTTPYGSVENPINIPRLAIAAGATFVAKFTSYHAKMLEHGIAEALLHKGFSVVEVITGCPTQWKMKPSDILEAQKKYFKKKDQTSMDGAETNRIGIFKRVICPEFCTRIGKIAVS